MSTSLRSRLTINIIAVLLIGMGLATSLAWRVVEGLYINTQCENLLAQAELTAASLQDLPISEQPAEPYSQYFNTLPGLHTRLLDEQGAIAVSLPLTIDNISIQAPLAENSSFIPAKELLQRPEIQQAQQGNPATAIRRVPSTGNRRVLYAAAPVLSDNEISGIVYLATPLPSASLPAGAILQLFGALLIALLLAATTGALIASRIATPIENVAKAAKAVAAGNLQTQAPTETNINELHSLGQAFNAMTTSLRQSEQAKNAFIADVTHELRTPLTVIKGTIETLEDGALDDLEGRGPLLASMQRESERLIRLVHDLLVLTQADAGVLKLNLEKIDLGELARTRCKALTPLADRRQVKLRVGYDKEVKPGKSFYALGDVDRLAQVFDNLLDNAIRHAPASSIINVNLQSEREEIRCTISDRGPGIPPEHLPLIFERFYRVDASRNRHTGGAGLGLSIVKALISAQNGRIRADSVEGQGTKITFWLQAIR